MKRVLLGVSASIAAYKAATLVTELKKVGLDVQVVMTQHSTAFISPLTLEVLSGHPVQFEVMAESTPGEIGHIQLAQTCDLLVIAPGTANLIGKIANGIADDMLSTVCLALGPTVPKLIAPAMNTKMYEQPVVQANLSKLNQYGYELITPVSQRLACGDVGIGAMAKVPTIVAAVKSALTSI